MKMALPVVLSLNSLPLIPFFCIYWELVLSNALASSKVGIRHPSGQGLFAASQTVSVIYFIFARSSWAIATLEFHW